MSKPRILSGVQTSGNLHLGNYLGALRNWVSLQDSHQCFFMLADLHAITLPQDPAQLLANTREVAAGFLAAGIDTDKSVIFAQSSVSAHAELAWILNCHTPLGWLNRMTQFKEKTHQGKAGIEELAKKVKIFLERDVHPHLDDLSQYTESSVDNLIEDVHLHFKSSLAQTEELTDAIKARDESLKEALRAGWNLLKTQTDFLDDLIRYINADIENISRAKLGLYSYPVLQAADILTYKATHVPVGEDQKQHLELARDIAGAFNRAVGQEFFPLPEPMILPAAARIMSLNDGTRKMSKSDESDYSRINLTDDADAIANKIKKAQTDSEASLSFDEENRPSVSNLIKIYAALSHSTPQKVAEQFSTLKTGQFKAQLAELAVEKLSPITAKMRELKADPGTIDKVLKRGAEAANDTAQPILKEAKKLVGFWQA